MNEEKNTIPNGESQDSPKMDNKAKENISPQKETGITSNSDANPVSTNSELNDESYSNNSMNDVELEDDDNEITNDYSDEVDDYDEDVNKQLDLQNKDASSNNKFSNSEQNKNIKDGQNSNENNNENNSSKKQNDKNSKQSDSSDNESQLNNEHHENDSSEQKKDGSSSKDKKGSDSSSDSDGDGDSGSHSLLSLKKSFDNFKAAGKEEDELSQARLIIKGILSFVFSFNILFLPVLIIIGYGISVYNKAVNVISDSYSAAATAGRIDPEDLFESVWLDHKEIIDNSLESTVYPSAIKDAKTLCESLGYEWDETAENLSATNSDDWTSVFGEINYGHLIIGTNISYQLALSDKEKLDEIDMEAILSSSDVYKHLYYLTYEEKEVKVKDKTKTELFIKINPFAIEDLSAILDKRPEEILDKDKALYTYLDQFNMQTAFMTACATQDVIEKLNLNNTTEIYHVNESITIEESTEEYEEIDLGDFETDGWYSLASDVVSETNPTASPSKKFDGWLRLYSEPTGTISSSSFYTNIEKAVPEIYKDVNDKVGNVSNLRPISNWCGYEFGVWDYYYNSNNQKVLGAIHYCKNSITQETGGKLAVNNDGRYLIAVAPGLVKANYWSDTGGVGNNAAWYDYSNKKIDLVLKEKNTGNVYYVPCALGDSKGHTFPYGIIQTGVATPSAASSQVDGATFKKDQGIKNRDHYYKNLGSVEANGYASILDTFSTKLYNEEKYTISQWMTHGPIEFYYTSDKSCIARMNNSFELIGTITY